MTVLLSTNNYYVSTSTTTIINSLNSHSHNMLLTNVIQYYYTLLILFSLFQTRCALLDYQQITIYADNCCKGKNESFTSNSNNFEKVSSIIRNSQMKSFSINRGLWALSPTTNYSTIGVFKAGNDKERHDESGDESILGTCSSTARGNGEYTQYKSIRHVGNSFINLPGLSFYTNNNLFGSELYFDGSILKLPAIFEFKSYGFTPRGISWTIYNHFNYSGNATCLKSQDKTVTAIYSKRDHDSRHGSSTDDQNTIGGERGGPEDNTFKIGSIKRGCFKADTIKKEKKQHKQQDSNPQSQPPSPHHHHINIITLHSKVNQHGTELMTDAMELRLPSAHLFKSYSFIGHKNWTIFNGIEFNGPARCLFNPKSTPRNTFMKHNGSSIHQSIHLVVGSIKRGCETDPIKEVITPPPQSAFRDGQTGGAAGNANYESNIRFNCIIMSSVSLLLFIQNNIFLVLN